MDHDEVDMILSEIDSIPYQNDVEAVKFSIPEILLIILLNVVDRHHRLIGAYPSISNGKLVVLKHNN